MIEEIKKEIYEMNVGILKDIVLTKEVFKILDKYNNQPDYKLAWNELKESQSTNCAYVNLGEELEVRFEELEQKYNLSGE